MTNTIYRNEELNLFGDEQPGYLYACIDPETKDYYIGVRTANKLPPIDDLGKVYKTSSKIVKPNFEKYDYFILFESYDYDGLRMLENMMIHSAKLAHNSKVLNIFYFDVTKENNSKNFTFSKVDREKHRLATKNGMYKQDNYEKFLKANKAAQSKPEARLRNSESQKIAQNRTEVKVNNVLKAIERMSVKDCYCEFCDKNFTKSLYTQWHGDNCLMNPNGNRYAEFLINKTCPYCGLVSKNKIPMNFKRHVDKCQLNQKSNK